MIFQLVNTFKHVCDITYNPFPYPFLMSHSKQRNQLGEVIISAQSPFFITENSTEIAFSTEIYNRLTFSWLAFTEQPKTTTTITEPEAEEERNKTRYLFRSKPNVHEATLL